MFALFVARQLVTRMFALFVARQLVTRIEGVAVAFRVRRAAGDARMLVFVARVARMCVVLDARKAERGVAVAVAKVSWV